jgi:hypothetical protein
MGINLVNMNSILNERIRELTVAQGNCAAFVHHHSRYVAHEAAYCEVNRDGARYDTLILGLLDWVWLRDSGGKNSSYILFI